MSGGEVKLEIEDYLYQVGAGLVVWPVKLPAYKRLTLNG